MYSLTETLWVFNTIDWWNTTLSTSQ